MRNTNVTLAAMRGFLSEKGIDARLHGRDVAICGADCDSRLAGPGHVFVCKGTAFSPRTSPSRKRWMAS